MNCQDRWRERILTLAAILANSWDMARSVFNLTISKATQTERTRFVDQPGGYTW